ncbi:hypothetical protein, partial [Lancefieldella rimae]
NDSSLSFMSTPLLTTRFMYPYTVAVVFLASLSAEMTCFNAHVSIHRFLRIQPKSQTTGICAQKNIPNLVKQKTEATLEIKQTICNAN